MKSPNIENLKRLMLKRIFYVRLVILTTLCSFSLNAQIQFRFKEKLTTSSNFYAIQIADINNDSLLDVIGATSYVWDSSPEDAKIYIYYQGSNGKLEKKTTLDYPKFYSGLKSLDIGDINNDNLNDIVIAYSDSIGISYQNQLGNFSKFESYYCARSMDQVMCLDINNDLKTDIIAKNSDYDSYIILFEQKDQDLEKRIISNPKHYAFELFELGDLNNDKLPDLLYYNTYGHPEKDIFVMMNNSDRFTNDSFSLDYSPDEINRDLHDFTIGDISFDVYNDILAINNYTDSIYYWINIKSSFETPMKIRTDEYADRLKVVDLNCDCLNEILAVAHFSISVHEPIDSYNSFKTFQIPNQHSSPTMWYNQFDIGDLNNDSKPDIAIAYLDGIVILENTSGPIEFSSIDTVIQIDTLTHSWDTFQYVEEFVNIIDSSIYLFVKKTDSVLIKQYSEYGDITIDTTFIRFGEICGNDYVDTLRSDKIYTFFNNVILDSTQFYTKNDTLKFIESIEQDVTIYPNPSQNEIKIFLNNVKDYQNFKFEIFSIEGRKLMFKDYNENIISPVRIDISGLETGQYIVIFILGNKKIMKKFIKV